MFRVKDFTGNVVIMAITIVEINCKHLFHFQHLTWLQLQLENILSEDWHLIILRLCSVFIQAPFSRNCIGFLGVETAAHIRDVWGYITFIIWRRTSVIIGGLANHHLKHSVTTTETWRSVSPDKGGFPLIPNWLTFALSSLSFWSGWPSSRALSES